MTDYVLRTSARAKYMRLEVHPGGSVVVTVPQAYRESEMKNFIARHGVWIERAVSRMRLKRVITIARRDRQHLKKEAQRLAEERCTHYAQKYGFTFGKISIRAQKSRWGSCSRAGNLSFNYKIAALPVQLREYVIVHEICHLGAFDHSKKFWELVSQEVPDHKAYRAQLRRIAFREA